MKQSEAAKILGKSRTYINKAINGKIQSDDIDKILLTLSFFEETLPEIFLDERFTEICEIAIMKGRTLRVKEFAARCKEYSTMLRLKRETNSN